jgi:hypothetical protein
MPLRKGTYIKATHVRIIKFKVTTAEPGPPKRGKYKAERRREVNIVRQNRACLRCSLLKIKVCFHRGMFGELLILNSVTIVMYAGIAAI